MNVKTLLQILGVITLLPSVETACADERLSGQLETLRTSQSELQKNLTEHRSRKDQIESLLTEAQKREKAFTEGRETVHFAGKSYQPETLSLQISYLQQALDRQNTLIAQLENREQALSLRIDTLSWQLGEEIEPQENPND